MERSFKQTFGVVGGLLVKDGKILLVRESGKADKDKWNQPAGWPEVGEDLVLAAKREVEEETGYEFNPTALLGVYSLVRKDLTEKYKDTPHAIKLIFVGEISAEPVHKLSNDISETKWFLPSEIERMDLNSLRDLDIKKMVRDYFAGQKYPLVAIKHTISEPL
jgi:ADP-ribose pyrophosphatase YjhB (NUDIX family)